MKTDIEIIDGVPHTQAMDTWTAPEIFPGLRGVTAADLDKVMAGFSADQWNWLAAGCIDQVFGFVYNILHDVLGFGIDEDRDDALDLFFRISQAYNAHIAGDGGAR